MQYDNPFSIVSPKVDSENGLKLTELINHDQ